MEFDQLFIVLLIILFSLGDVFIRWLRKRSGQLPPADVEEEVAQVEQEETSATEPEWWESEAEPEPLPQRAPPATRPAAAAPPWQTPPPPPPPLLAPVPKPPGPRRKVLRRRAWLTPSDVRRGIVLLTVLGPCRGLESERN